MATKDEDPVAGYVACWQDHGDGKPCRLPAGHETDEGYSAVCDWCHIEVRNPVQPPNLVKIVAEPLPGDLTEWHVDLDCYSFLLRLISRLASDKARYG